MQERESVRDGHGECDDVVGMQRRSLEVFVERAVSVVLEDDEMVRRGVWIVSGIETVDVLVTHVLELCVWKEGEIEREREREKEGNECI